MREYYKRHPEKWRQWYDKNAEKKKAESRRRYAENREQALEYARSYRQSNPELVLRRTQDWRDRNRQYTRDYAKRWARENPERVKDSNDRRRAREFNAPVVETVDRLSVWTSHGGRCHICRRPVSRRRFHVDHLVPLSRGGDHAAHNLAPAHPRCNLRRGAGRLPAQLKLVA